MDKKIKEYQITEYPWTANGYTPKVDITLEYDKNGFEVLFTIYESEIRTIETEHQADVYCDSCVEFFVQFSSLTVKPILILRQMPMEQCSVQKEQRERIVH